MADFRVEPLAEDALLLRFGDGIDTATNARVHAAARALRDADLPGIADIAPAYATLLLRFDPLAWTEDAGVRLEQALSPERLLVRGRGLGEGANIMQKTDAGDSRTASPLTLPSPPSSTMGEREIVVVPVCYGGEYGPDIDAVAEHAGLSRDDVIARHTAAEYTVAMLGFAPGFPYLLGLDASLHVPRRATPRTRVAAGSVAIGGAQTGIYPRELPGGWHLIGRTPRVLFDSAREPPCLLAPGDRVRFRAIEADEFARRAERDA
ncbi:MAG TPA: 5-oxoprolinase subunit PxpB [Rhodanobacteraceae bacterium]|nr:5-oxoprolinase subunit PxpB [Rhodanobacteraceae bacterium]